MGTLVDTLALLNLLLFAALGVVALRQWLQRRDRVAMWAALCFATLGVVFIIGRVVPQVPHGLLENASQRLLLIVFLLFPYCLYRFTLAFRPAPARLDRFLGAMTVTMIVWTLVLPHRLPAAGEPRPLWFWAYLVGFLVHWTVLAVIVTARLWRAGRHEPTVARRRMQLLAVASATITVALFATAGSSDPHSTAELVAQVIGLVSGVCFLLGLAPPGFVRAAWRRPEQRRVQETIQDLMRIARSEQEIIDRVLQPFAAIIGARAAAILDANGNVLGRYERFGDGEARTTMDVPAGDWTIEVTTTPYAPYFGSEELTLMETLGALTGLALDRGRLFAQEREARLALQRADRLKTDFVALAAHELRTPVTTIYGFVQTLNHVGDRLDAERREEISAALEEQTVRMASLVEQLLDLSRLDAEAIEIAPQPLDLRVRLEELAHAAAGERHEDVEVRVPDGLVAPVDPHVLERVVTNLVANAFRYGEAPVIVTAEQRDRHVRIAVEDRGPGVSAEFVPELFERFARSERSRAVAGGTGLGLAIAKSYARAHSGDLIYTDATPTGARFELVLPAS